MPLFIDCLLPRARRFPFRRQIANLVSLAIAIGYCCAGVARGDVSLPAIFSDNMVLQHLQDVNVWGKADPAESVTVQLGPETTQTVAGKDGSWRVRLPGLPSGGPYDLTVSGKNSVTIRNVAIGEVWVCAGESNMEYKVIASRNGQKEMADGNLPMVRVFVVKHAASETPQGDCEGSWVVCDPDTVRDFSAVGFFFARELNRGMRMPFGIIESAWGPSPAEAWTPLGTLEKDPALHVTLDRYNEAAKAYPAAQSDYAGKLADWQTAAAGAKAAGTVVPPKPVPPLAPAPQREPAALYNGMIAPLQHFAMRGVLWYQGESNVYDAGLYAKLFPAMIEAWRAGWGEGEFPFLYVQLSSFLWRHPQPEESSWAELREAQAAALKVPKTGMAVSADIGDEHEMHPANKQDVAHRLVLLAESQAYGQPTEAVGPMYSGMQVEDGKAVITFTHAGGGLVARNGAAVKGFELAGADRQFAWADARIDGEKVIVHSKDVPEPLAVRYGWADCPECDLFNQAGLPVAPFRTDEWVAGVADSGQAVAGASPAASPGKKKHRRIDN